MISADFVHQDIAGPAEARDGPEVIKAGGWLSQFVQNKQVNDPRIIKCVS